MDKTALLTAWTSIICLLLPGCTSTTKPPDSSNSPQSEVIGLWSYVLPASPSFGIPDTLTIALDIHEAGKACELSVSKPNALYLLKIDGTWSIAGDTLVMQGSEGVIVDTSANPDSLKPLAATALTLPIRIPIKMNSDKQWIVSMSDLGIVINAFPVSESMKATVRNLELNLIKKQ
jgi:hypothetical protein